LDHHPRAKALSIRESLRFGDVIEVVLAHLLDLFKDVLLDAFILNLVDEHVHQFDDPVVIYLALVRQSDLNAELID
jgi:hypothetical protein